MLRNFYLVVFSVIGVFALVVSFSATGEFSSLLSSHERSTARVTTKDGLTFELKVIAVTKPSEMAQGLMNVKYLPLDTGMLFVHSSERIIHMWMKNTIVPLDMWFISKDGKIVEIKHNAVPFSLDTISSKYPAKAVLEVNAGLSQRLGVTKGAKVNHSSIRSQ